MSTWRGRVLSILIALGLAVGAVPISATPAPANGPPDVAAYVRTVTTVQPAYVSSTR